MPRRGSPYDRRYQQERLALLAHRPACALRIVCDGAPADSADHDPPLALHAHRPGSGCCRLRPACLRCQAAQAGDVSSALRLGVDVATLRPGRKARSEPEEFVEPDGFAADARLWDLAPWLDDLRDVPDGAVWPRLMTAPHPAAVDSLGREFEWWCRAYRGVTLRWFQRLVARRLLEVDAEGRLVWLVLLLTLSRQLGKSWFLWLILSWRLHQGERFGVPQRLLHMSIQMSQVRDVMNRRVSHRGRRPRPLRRRWTTTTTPGSSGVPTAHAGSACARHGAQRRRLRPVGRGRGRGRRGVVDPGHDGRRRPRSRRLSRASSHGCC